MAVLGTVIAVATVAVPIIANGSASVSEVILRNADAAGSVFLGGATVGTLTGYGLLAGVVLGPRRLYAGETIYGITASGTVNVHVLQTHG